MKNFFMALSTIMFFSCSESNTDKSTTGFYINAHISVLLKNSEGIDVLGNDKYPNSGIVAKYLINGAIVQNTSNGIDPDYPNNVMIVKQGDSHYIIVHLNLAASEEYPITYIHWNTSDVDTIKAQYKRTENSVVLEKAWLFKNNNWEELTSQEITIVK